MTFVDVIWLALLQGITEFLPVSSSAHLILFSQLLGKTDQGIAFDVAVHSGSLLAVIYYFREQLKSLLFGCLDSIQTKNWNNQSKLGLNLIIATLPIVVVGALAHDLVATSLRNLTTIAITMIGFGLLLGIADRQAGSKTEHQLSMTVALCIGLAQVLAIIPGTSRSGITMTAALLLGLNHQAAARFAFLLSIPAIAGSGLIKLTELAQADQPEAWATAITGLVISALFSFFSIGLFLKLLERIGLMPFVIYRCALGLILLLFLF